MGLTSLPVLNKVGYRNYWGGLWYSDFNYTTLLTQNLFVELFFYVWMTDRFFSTRYLKTKKFQVYASLSYKNIYFIAMRRSIVCGEVWFLRYQGWVILSPSFCSDYFGGGVQVGSRFLKTSVIGNFFEQFRYEL